MVNVRDRGEFEAWLRTQPHKTVTLIAARAALRVTPYLGQKGRTERAAYLVLPSFWALASALCVASSTSPHDVLQASSASSAAAAYADEADAYTAGGTSETAGDFAAVAAAEAADADAAAAVEAAETAEAYAAADDASSHIYLQKDIDHLLSGEDLLQKLPLWHEGDIPADLQRRWAQFRKDLLKQDKNWSVWTDWYEALIKGNAPFMGIIEIGDPNAGHYGRCTFPKDYYRDPPRLNAALRAVIDGYWAKTRKTIPPKKPASIRPIFKNGRLSLNPTPLDPELEAELAAANLQAVRNEMRELAEDVRLRGNVNADPAVHLERTANLIPDGIPDALTLFGLVRKQAILMECLSMINDQWPDGLAAHYRANCSELSKALDMFLDRRTARRQSIKSELEDQELDVVMVDMQAQTDILRDDDNADIIDVEISDALDGIAEDYAEATSEASKIIIATDMVESQNNLLKTLAEEGLKPENFQGMNLAIRNAYAQALPAGIIEGAAEGGHEDGKKIGKAIARANAGKEAGFILFKKYPKIFGWMKNLPFIGQADDTDV